ncbi:DNA/RNA polymerase [Testicularia cyperi]|uniref:DNA polymerase eta n=1 Tax=Testicularia cyperi TaxID=1882483 RepID=A0A317XZZ8_9BASI|nr:DNA/RNA polymerase [Testicularia cyperi]
MASPKKAAQRYSASLAAGLEVESSNSDAAHAHNLFERPPSLLPPEPTERPVPSHTNLETAVHASGPPPWPTITYKHVLSAGTLNPTNPLRVIAHCDVDAAYAQFEASRLGLDATVVPIAVQQWQGLIAVNYPARDAGVSRFESIPDALKKCPDLHLVHVATYAHGSNQAEYHVDPKPETHKVSLDPYRRESNKILSIFKSTCPAGAVEKASIDESYFDLTIEVRKLMIERFPYLKDVPPDDPTRGTKGMDAPLPPPPRLGLQQWKQLGYVVPKSGDVGKATGIGRPEKAVAKGALLVDAPIGAGWVSPMPPATTRGADSTTNGNVKSGEQAAGTDGKTAEGAIGPSSSWSSEDRLTDPTSSQQAELDEEAALWDRIEYGETTWTDVALALGAELMNRVRQNVIDELGYTTSAGIASNKTLSKLCSSWRKPNGQTIMRPCSVPNFFSSLPFQKIRFLGGKLGTAIGQEWSSATVADLWSVTLDEMQAKFGEEARWVYNVLRGIDHSEVRERVNNQTMLASKSVRPAITRAEEAMHWLTILATELAIRLKEARVQRHNLWPKTLVLRYIRAGSVPRSRQTAFPFTNPNSQDELAAVILKKGERLWKESVGDALGPQGAGSVDGGKVLTIALGFSGLEEGEVGQRGIEGFLGSMAARPSGTSTTCRPSSAQTASSPVDEPTTPVKKRKRSRLDELFEQTQRRNALNASDSGSDTPTDAKAGPSTAADSATVEEPMAGPGDRTNELESNGFLDSLEPGTSASKAAALGGVTVATDPPKEEEEEGEEKEDGMPTWQCAQCGEVLRPPLSAAAFERPYLLEKLKEEHQDWHFAVTLSQAVDDHATSSQATRPSSSASSSGVVRKKKKPVPPKGLEKFFGKKPS